MRPRGLRDDPEHRCPNTIRIPSAFFDLGWPFLLPPTCVSLYKAVCRLAETDIRGYSASLQLQDRLFISWEADTLDDEINRKLFFDFCQKNNWPQPETVDNCLEVLLMLGLIQRFQQDGQLCIDIVLPVPEPYLALERPELASPIYIKMPPEAVL